MVSGRLAVYRFPLVLIVLGAANIAALALHLMLGDYPIPFGEALNTVLYGGGGRADFIVNTLRLPRALVAFLVGCGLALAGVILQAITRNPLASPGVVGLNSGAALAAVATIIAFPALPVSLLPFAAFAGAFAAASISYLLAWRRGVSPVRLLLVGVGVSSAAGAMVTFLLTTGKINDTKRAVLWMTGSVYGRSWEHVWPLLPWILVLFPLLLLLARQIDAVRLGDELAKGLGTSVERVRGLLLLLAVGLAGSSVATAGTIGFVGLMAPHIASHMVGTPARRLLPTAALTGGLIVLTADLLGRTVLKPIEIPCGIVIALVGAPYMVILLYRNRNL